MLELELIDDWSCFIEIGPQWSAFVETIPGLTPFQTPEWLITWWLCFGHGTLQVFLFRDQGSIVGIVPCFLHEWQGRRQLTLIGSGISDYLEPAISAHHRSGIISQLRDRLKSSASWKVCNWQDLSHGTPLVDLSIDPALCVRHEPDLPCSEIYIERSFEEYWAARPSGLRRNLRRYREKAEQISPVEFTASSLKKEPLEALIRLHSARWKEHGEPGMIAANRSTKFLREVSSRFDQKQMLLLFSLRFQDEIVAVILAFPYRGVLYAYLSAFDPAYASLGFGRTLLYESLQYSFHNQFSAWNFLRGGETYKFDWGAREIRKTRLIITRGPSVIG